VLAVIKPRLVIMAREMREMVVKIARKIIALVIGFIITCLSGPLNGMYESCSAMSQPSIQ